MREFGEILPIKDVYDDCKEEVPVKKISVVLFGVLLASFVVAEEAPRVREQTYVCASPACRMEVEGLDGPHLVQLGELAFKKGETLVLKDATGGTISRCREGWCATIPDYVGVLRLRPVSGNVRRITRTISVAGWDAGLNNFSGGWRPCMTHDGKIAVGEEGADRTSRRQACDDPDWSPDQTR